MISAGQMARQKLKPDAEDFVSQRRSKAPSKSTTKRLATRCTSLVTGCRRSSMRSLWSLALGCTPRKPTTRPTKCSPAKRKTEEILTSLNAPNSFRWLQYLFKSYKGRLGSWRSIKNSTMSCLQILSGDSTLRKSKQSNSILCLSHKSAQNWINLNKVEAKKSSSLNLWLSD